ncbi:MAG: 1-phosphofructokinase [Streptococcaceae bacterium]|jgi:1-phosphofructokinase|nr:1-phosphofructokinase [Streptococcaceae bacterium]
MIYTVTLNPSIDLYVDLDTEKFAKGQTNRAVGERKEPGGKGLTVSRVLNEIGTVNVATGFIGGATGDYIVNTLKDEGVNTLFTRIAEDTRINIKLVGKTITEINTEGPQVFGGDVLEFMDNFDRLQPGDIVVLAGSAPRCLGISFYAQIINKVRELGAEFVLDVDSKKLFDFLQYEPLLVKPNLEEVKRMFDTDAKTAEEVLPLAKRLLEAGAKNVIVSLGGDGSVFVSSEKAYRAMGVKGEVKNTVGAGDSMVAGFIHEWAQSQSEKTALITASACGTATAFSLGLCTAPEVYEMKKKIIVNEL